MAKGRVSRKPVARSPERRTFSAIAWSMLIIRDAMMGLRRFSEFQKNLGVAKEHPGRCAASRAGERDA